MVVRYLPEVSSELTHHGIKGQKWGIRRFQNKDGSLTNKGKKRYGLSYTQRLERKIDKEFEANKAEGITKSKSESAEMTLRKQQRRIGLQAAGRAVGSFTIAAGSMAVAALTGNPIWLAGVAAFPATVLPSSLINAYKNMKIGDLKDKYGIPDSEKVRLT